MISFSALLVTAAALVGVYAVLATNVAEGFEHLAIRTVGIPEPTGAFFTWWTDGDAQVTFINGAGGQYTFTWSGNGTAFGGKGWNPGTSSRVITYTGIYKPNGNSYLAISGWTRYPLIEYYIVESYGPYNPSSAASKRGSVSCNGATYDILVATQINKPSIDGTSTFQQFWSVRNPKKAPGGSISGTVNIACHFSAWASLGMGLGSSHNYQIIATQGYFSNGTSTISVA